MLVIEPLNGLSNRLRVINSGIALAEELNKQLRVDWLLNGDLNCRFDKLFEPIEGITINDGIRLSYPFNRHPNLHYLYKSLKFDISLNSTSFKTRLKNENLKNYLYWFNKIYITTGEAFFPAPLKYYFFKPKPSIMDGVNLMCNKLGPDFIGIHIRRTDNKNAILFSPTSLFIKEIKYLLTIDASIKFFLSTDSLEDQMLLKNTFPNNIFFNPKILNRNQEKGIQDALVDIICLSKASKIYGSFYSSFSEAATYFTGNKLIILKK